MSGIAGFIGLSDKNLIMRMCDSIRRPNDKYELIIDDNISLCMTFHGARPILENEMGTLHIVYDGEVYNYEEILSKLSSVHSLADRSGLAVALHLYEDHSKHAFNYLNGRFAIAIWDPGHNEIVLARDHVGLATLFYTSSEQGLFFASEIRPLLHVSLPRVNSNALIHYLVYGYVSIDETLFEGIYKVPSGGYISYTPSTGSLRKRRYWNLDQVFGNDTSKICDLDVAADTIYRNIQSSVTSRLDTDVNVGILLSGGLDSSTLASIMRKRSRENIRAYMPVSLDGDVEANCRLVADWLQLDLREVLITPNAMITALEDLVTIYDDLIGELPASILTYLLMKEACGQASSIFTGDGGDEIFWGYPWIYRWEAYSSALSHLPRLIRKATYSISRTMLSFRNIRPVSAIKNLSEASLMSPDGRLTYMLRVFYNDQLQQICPSRTAQNVDEFLLNLVRIYKNLDNMSKRYIMCLHALTCRFGSRRVTSISRHFSLRPMFPFLDRELMEHMMLTSPSLKQRGMHTKVSLRYMLKKYKLLPDKVINQKKRGFSTYSWLKGPVTEFAKETLCKDIRELRAILDDRATIALLKRNALSQESLFALFLLILWYKKYLKNFDT